MNMLETARKVRVAIDFRTEDPRQGIGTALLALAHGLSKLKDTNQEYVFVVYEHTVEWLRPHIFGACSVVGVPSPNRTSFGAIKRAIKKVPFARTIWNVARSNASMIPSSDGVIESLHCDVVHFPCQAAYITRVPSIYQPWDLQHCHLPQFFSQDELRMRELRYPAFCKQASYVCVQTEWGKQDMVAQFGIAPDKIKVIRWGSAFEAYSRPSEPEIEQVRKELTLPSEFLIYPAITWPHKNHELIIRGLALMKQKTGAAVEVVFTGATTEYREHLEKLATTLGVSQHLRFLGYVTSKQIQAIFHLASAMIFPSKFEGLGLPILEAFRVGLPVACSTATVLPEVAGDAAIFFDADSPEEFVLAIERLLSSPELRSELIARGYHALERYSADAAAEEVVKLYERTACGCEKENC
jgi:glycosyltransferase involved in cell wall biosynthesis